MTVRQHAGGSSTVKWANRLGSWAAIAGTAAVMLHWTWRTWPDVLVDFGQQIYTAWRLSQGDVLYRDLLDSARQRR